MQSTFGPFFHAAVLLTFVQRSSCVESQHPVISLFPTPHQDCECQQLRPPPSHSPVTVLDCADGWKHSALIKLECCMIDSVPSVILAASTHSNPLTLFTLLLESAFHSDFTFFFASWARPSLPSSVSPPPPSAFYC